MNSEPTGPQPPARRSSVFRNWLSLTGLVVVVGSLFSFALLLLVDALARSANPYLGILTYLVAPAVLVLGLFLSGLGAWLRRRQIARAAGSPPPLPASPARRRGRGSPPRGRKRSSPRSEPTRSPFS
jgi:hypothetical protein